MATDKLTTIETDPLLKAGHMIVAEDIRIIRFQMVGATLEKIGAEINIIEVIRETLKMRQIICQQKK